MPTKNSKKLGKGVGKKAASKKGSSAGKSRLEIGKRQLYYFNWGVSFPSIIFAQLNNKVRHNYGGWSLSEFKNSKINIPQIVFTVFKKVLS